MGLIIAKSLCGGYDFSDIGLSTSICVEVEEIEEVFDLFEVEGGVFCDDGFGEDFLPFFFDDCFAIDGAHRYFDSNII